MITARTLTHTLSPTHTHTHTSNFILRNVFIRPFHNGGELMLLFSLSITDISCYFVSSSFCF